MYLRMYVCQSVKNLVRTYVCVYVCLPPGFLSLFQKEEPLPELFPQMPVSGYYWPRRTQVSNNVVSPSSLLPCPTPGLIAFLTICNTYQPILRRSDNVCAIFRYRCVQDGAPNGQLCRYRHHLHGQLNTARKYVSPT